MPGEVEARVWHHVVLVRDGLAQVGQQVDQGTNTTRHQDHQGQ